MFRRRRTSRRASGTKRRKTYWGNGVFVGQEIELGTEDVASSWAKWPSGLFDPDFTGPTGAPQLAPSEETWTRCVVQSTTQVPVQGALPQTLPMQVVVGLIAWDASSQADALALDNVVTSFTGPGGAPSPTLRSDFDWIIRIPFQYIADNLFSFAADATFLNSRAMRKLPPSTGVLWCVSALQPLAPSEPTTINWSLDVRYLLKSGYYGL